MLCLLYKLTLISSSKKYFKAIQITQVKNISKSQNLNYAREKIELDWMPIQKKSKMFNKSKSTISIILFNSF